MPNSDEGVEKLIDNLADPYLEDNGSMKETAKGLKEMRISAAWLRNYSIDTEIDVSKEPPALSVYTEKYCKDSIGFLQYPRPYKKQTQKRCKAFA